MKAVNVRTKIARVIKIKEIKMVIWKWLCKQNLFIKIIGILLYLGLYVYVIDIVITAFTNAKNGSTTLKRELCCLIAWNVLFLMCMLIDNDVSAEFFIIGTIGLYFPMFTICHGVIIPMVNFLKRKKQENELQAENYKIVKEAENLIRDYFYKKDNEFIKSKFKVAKNIPLDNCINFIVDVENKTFTFFTSSFCSTAYHNVVDDLVYKRFDLRKLHEGTIDINSLKEEIYSKLASKTYNYNECKVYSFSDLNRVEFIDKSRTDEKRTYTMESKAGNALLGAVAGSMLSETIFNEFATAGAVIGASGERKITENVERSTHIELCVNVYLNDIDMPYQTFTFKSENKLREFIGALEYIKNNK